MIIAENDKIAFPGYLYLPPLSANMLSFMRIYFVAVPSVNPVDGLLMAEKIRKGVELQPFTWQQKTLYLTVSIGVGSGCASYRTLTDDFNKLMVEADTCLYRSKKDGRNRTSTMRYGEEVV